MLSIILLLTQVAFGYIGTPIDVASVKYEEVTNGPSCRLLKHRHKERDKVLREALHLEGHRFKSKLKKYLTINELMTNQEFIDLEVATDESMEISLHALVTDSLDSLIQERGLENIFFSIKGLGVTWNGLAGNFPDNFLIDYNQQTRTLAMRYRIYRVDYCFKELKAAHLSWVDHKKENVGELLDFAKNKINDSPIPTEGLKSLTGDIQ